MKRLKMKIAYSRYFSSSILECKYDFTVFKEDIIKIITTLIDKFRETEPKATIHSIECKIEDFK